MAGDHEDLDFDEEASTEWKPDVFEMREGLVQKPTEDLVTQIGKTRGRMHENGAIGRKRPSVFKIVNTARHGGFDFRGPELVGILSDYILAPEKEDEKFSLNFEELISIFLRMYADLKDNYHVTDERWDEIKEYLAAELARHINSGQLAEGNMGLKPRAFLRRDIPAIIQAQIDASKKQPAFQAETALKTVRALTPNFERAFDEVIHYPLGILIQEAYQAEIKARKKAACWLGICTTTSWQKKVDREYDDGGGFGENFKHRLREAFERDLAEYTLNPSHNAFRRLSELSPSLKIHCEKEKIAISSRAATQTTNHSEYETTRAIQVTAIERRFRDELIGALKRQTVELFGGELVVVAQSPGALKYQLSTKPMPESQSYQAQIFCADPKKMQSF